MQFAVSLLLARLLAPEHFGLLGMAMVVSGLVKRCSNLGFRAAIVQRKEIDELFLTTVFWTNLAVFSSVGIVLCLLSPAIATLYQEPQVQRILVALAFNFVIVAFSAVPSALLQRDLRFKSLAMRELLGTLIGGIVAIVLALLGWGVWALVLSTLSVSLTHAIVLNWILPTPMAFRYDGKRLREALSFGLHLTGSDIFNYLARNADNLIIGVAFGPAALGFYTFAYRLMLLPRDSLTQVVNRVLFPKLCREQNDDRAMASISLRACSAIAFISFPLMAGLALLAEPFTLVVVGEKWLPAVPLLWILAPLGALQSLGPMATYLILAKGRSDISFYWSIINGTFLMGSFALGSLWGILGVAAVYAIASLIIIPISFIIAYRLVEGLSFKHLLQALAPYFIATCAMSGIVFLTFRYAELVVSQPVALILAIAAGVVSYSLFAIKAQLPAMTLFLDLLPGRSFQSFSSAKESP